MKSSYGVVKGCVRYCPLDPPPKDGVCARNCIKRTATAVLLSALPIGLDVFDELFRRFGPLFGPILGVVA